MKTKNSALNQNPQSLTNEERKSVLERLKNPQYGSLNYTSPNLTDEERRAVLERLKNPIVKYNRGHLA